jgi:hypothetical protein
VGQVQNSRRKISEIHTAISAVLTDAGNLSADLYAWLLDFTYVYFLQYCFSAKAILLQAEKEVAVRKPLAYPLAHLTILISQSHAQFMPILTGRYALKSYFRLMKRCPYLIPTYIAKLPTDSVADFKKRAGYRFIGGVMEKEAIFTERMSGIVALWAALSLKRPELWTWIARMSNMKPRSISPLLIFTFLEIAGAELVKVYQGQARKLIRYFLGVWIGMVPATAIAHATRLQLFLEQFEATGLIKEMEMRNLDP